MEIAALRTGHRRILAQLQRALRVLASSEKKPSKRPKSAGEPRQLGDSLQRLRQHEADAKELALWHRQCVCRQVQKARRARDKRMKLEDEDDDTLTEEDAAELAAEAAAFDVRLKLGAGRDPALVSHCETLMQGAVATPRHDTWICDVDRQSLPRHAEVRQSFSESRQRIDFSLDVRVMDMQVEKLCILTRDGDRRLVAGEVTDVGPSRMQVTWNFLANLSLLASQYAMPFARLGKLVSTPVKRFTAAELSRHYAFVAEHFVAIYRHLGLTLATAPVLAGDDTPSQVLEVSRALAREGKWSAEPPPWANYATQDRARPVTRHASMHWLRWK